MYPFLNTLLLRHWNDSGHLHPVRMRCWRLSPSPPVSGHSLAQKCHQGYHWTNQLWKQQQCSFWPNAYLSRDTEIGESSDTIRRQWRTPAAGNATATAPITRMPLCRSSSSKKRSFSARRNYRGLKQSAHSRSSAAARRWKPCGSHAPLPMSQGKKRYQMRRWTKRWNGRSARLRSTARWCGDKMTRRREFNPDSYYHVIIRGNNRQSIFQDEKGHVRTETCLIACTRRLTVHAAGGLLYDEPLPLADQKGAGSASKIMSLINRRYSASYAKRYRQVGPSTRSAILRFPSWPACGQLLHPPQSDPDEAADGGAVGKVSVQFVPAPPFLDREILQGLLPPPFDPTNLAYCLYCLTYQQNVEKIRT